MRTLSPEADINAIPFGWAWLSDQLYNLETQLKRIADALEGKQNANA